MAGKINDRSLSCKSGWEAVVEGLVKEDVKIVFGLPGENDLYPALSDADGIESIVVRHEAAAVFMAMGYAKVTGKTGFCHVSKGPGVTNIASGLLEAQATCSPIIAACPSTSRDTEGMGAIQECGHQVPMMTTITKWAYRVPRASRVPWALRRAFYLAHGGQPGPVYLEIPHDIGVNRDDIPGYVPAGKPLRSRGDSRKVEEAAVLRALRAVKRKSFL